MNMRELPNSLNVFNSESVFRESLTLSSSLFLKAAEWKKVCIVRMYLSLKVFKGFFKKSFNMIILLGKRQYLKKNA